MRIYWHQDFLSLMGRKRGLKVVDREHQDLRAWSESQEKQSIQMVSVFLLSQVKVVWPIRVECQKPKSKSTQV